MRSRMPMLLTVAAAHEVALMACASPSWCANCPDGTVVDNPTAGTVSVTWQTHDAQGNPEWRSATIIRPIRFTPSIESTVNFDATTGLYTYSYAIANNTASEQQIGSVEFAIPTDIKVGSFATNATTPGWQFFPMANRDGGFAWGFLLGSNRPDMSVEGIPQGGSVTFSFTSPRGPGPIKVYLRGVEPEVQFTSDLPGCVEDQILDITGFPRDYIVMDATGPVKAP